MRPVIRTRFGTRAVPREVDEELTFHIEMRTRQLIASGLTPDEAREQARRQFGDVDRVRDACITHDTERIRTMDRANLLQDLRQDVVYAARMLRRTPMVTLVVVLTLGLGIGANTAIFNLVDAVLLRKLPVRAPDELVVLGNPAAVGSMSFSDVPPAGIHSVPTWRRLQEDASLVSGLAATGSPERIELQPEAGGAVERPRGRMVSGNYFQVLGVPAWLGRMFLAGDDDAVGGAPVVAISHGYWQRRFGGDSSVIGRDVLINDARFTIVGVTPPGFTGEIVGQETEIWLPIAMHPVLWPNVPLLDDPQVYWLQLVGRLQPGVTLERAQSGFEIAVRAILTSQVNNPSVAEVVNQLDVPVSSGARGLSRVRRTYQAPLLILMAGVGLLLLIICANVGNILMARAVARGREMSVRLAMGARRSRLVRQLLTESVLLAGLGALTGLLLASWGSRLLLTLAADGGTAIPLDTGVGLVALGFTVAISLMAVLAFGLLPALRTSRVDLATAMRASSRAVSGGTMGQRNPLGRMLIAGQVALSVVLLVGAGLLVRSLQNVQRADTGVDRDRLLVVDLDVIAGGYAGDRLIALTTSLAERLRALPGVAAISYSENGLFLGTEAARAVGIPGFEARERSDTVAYNDQVGPGFAGAIGARLLRGRDFTDQDRLGAPRVILVNESFSRFYFGDESPVGMAIRVSDSTWAEVVGVIADVKDRSLTDPSRRRLYAATLQRPFGDAGALRYLIRTTGDPGALIPAVRQAVTAHDPDLPIADVTPLARLMRQSIREERLMARLASVFGGVALLLAGIGLYGVISYAVTRRANEIGLRVALGAQRGSVIRMVLRDAMLLVGIGIGFGVPLTLAASRVIRSQLHGVEATDPVTFGAALLVLAAGAVVAALLPAVRASRVEPVVALRSD
jgi:predicted permease